MTLQAVVFCNCFEKGRLRAPPPVGCRLWVAGDGALQCDSGDFYLQTSFACWLHDQACDHPDGILLRRELGGPTEIRLLRSALSQVPNRYPVFQSCLLVTGDPSNESFISADFGALRAEIMALADVRNDDPETMPLLRWLQANLTELLECAIFANKPIAFYVD